MKAFEGPFRRLPQKNKEMDTPTSEEKPATPKKQEGITKTGHFLENIEKQKLLTFRFFEQTESSRLAEYITGLRPDDPKMIERLIEDRKIIRTKYNLPDTNIRFDSPTEYETLLREIAKKNNVEIRSKSECGTFFEENSGAGGVYFGDSNNVGVDLKRNERSSYEKSLGTLEHELIHSEQQARYPNMPTELMEYEAYLAANINVEKFKEHPEEIEPILFSFFIGGSTRFWYKDKNAENVKKSLPKIKPVWNDPEYFLKNIDKINQDDIDTYKESNEDKINFKYIVKSDGDDVWVESRDRDTEKLVEKGWDIYCKLMQYTIVPEHEKSEIIRLLKEEVTVRPNGFSIQIHGKAIWVMNRNGRGYQSNRDLIKKAIGY